MTSSSARSPTAPSAAGPSTATARGMVKIVGESKYGELLGGHIVGTTRHRADPGARQRARRSRAATPRSRASIHGHPTLSEAVMEAARAADGWLIHG